MNQLNFDKPIIPRLQSMTKSAGLSLNSSARFVSNNEAAFLTADPSPPWRGAAGAVVLGTDQ